MHQSRIGCLTWLNWQDEQPNKVWHTLLFFLHSHNAGTCSDRHSLQQMTHRHSMYSQQGEVHNSPLSTLSTNVSFFHYYIRVRARVVTQTQTSFEAGSMSSCITHQNHTSLSLVKDIGSLVPACNWCNLLIRVT